LICTLSPRPKATVVTQSVATEQPAAPPSRAEIADTSPPREEFHGPVSYASLPFERVDWDVFDIVGVNHYFWEPVKGRYLRTLEPLLGSGKPVVITEFGFRTCTGAAQAGPLVADNIDPATFALHMLPLAGRHVRPRVKTIHERNEELQVASLPRQLEPLDSAGVDGAFVYTSTAPLWPHGDDPEHDLDTDSYSLVKPLPGGGHGTTYPDMAWEPEKSFTAVADYYATR
jgi:hypothetical protein